MGRGGIRHTGTAKVQNNGYNATLQLTSQPIMSPSARIVVYSRTNTNEIVVDSLSVSVDNPFKNQVRRWIIMQRCIRFKNVDVRADFV